MDFKQEKNAGQSPFELIDQLQRRIDDLESKVESEQFSDRYRIFKRFLIAKDGGKLQLEEKDAIPVDSVGDDVGVIGELVVVGGVLYLAYDTDLWRPVSSVAPIRSIAAGVASSTASHKDGIIQVSTSAGQAHTMTLPEAADNIGLKLIITFVADAGQNVTVNRVNADTIDDNGDTGNTTITMQDAGDTIIIQAVQDNIWAVINNIGCALT